MSTPTVSVVMAAYNGAALIGETLASLAAQTFTDWEAIVVDDCSSDSTAAVVDAFDDPRVRLIVAEENGGPVVARNLAFAEARGRYIAGLDQDDIALPTRFAAQVTYLDEHPECVLVATDATVFDERAERPTGHMLDSTPALLDWLIRLRNPIVWSTVMFRADAARQLQPFERPQRRYAEDFDLYHRLRRFGTLARIDWPLLRYRAHAGGASQRYHEAMIASATAVLREAWGIALGDDAPATADLLARYVLDGEAVPDLETLGILGARLVRLQALHVARANPSEADLRLICIETERLWWRIVRHAVRSGTVGLFSALRLAPSPLRLQPIGMNDLVVSGLVGAARRKRA